MSIVSMHRARGLDYKINETLNLERCVLNAGINDKKN